MVTILDIFNKVALIYGYIKFIYTNLEIKIKLILMYV